MKNSVFQSINSMILASLGIVISIVFGTVFQILILAALLLQKLPRSLLFKFDTQKAYKRS